MLENFRKDVSHYVRDVIKNSQALLIIDTPVPGKYAFVLSSKNDHI